MTHLSVPLLSEAEARQLAASWGSMYGRPDDTAEQFEAAFVREVEQLAQGRAGGPSIAITAEDFAFESRRLAKVLTGIHAPHLVGSAEAVAGHLPDACFILLTSPPESEIRLALAAQLAASAAALPGRSYLLGKRHWDAELGEIGAPRIRAAHRTLVAACQNFFDGQADPR